MINRFILLALVYFILESPISSQNCAYAGRDTIVCGLSFELVGNFSDGQWLYLCDSTKKTIVLEELSPGVSKMKVANCGSYIMVYKIDNPTCTSSDTVIINFENTSFRLEEINYKIELDYASINCQPSPKDSCGSIRVLTGIIPPIPNWKINMNGKCEVFNAMPTIYGANPSNCLADSINYNVNSLSVRDSILWTTSQQAFITLDANKKVISNRFNDFFKFINNSISDELEVKCPLQKCFKPSDASCKDTFLIDTLNIIMPIHLGGNWYLKQDTNLIKLSINNNIVINGTKYFMKVPMGGDYYGPDNISFELFSVNNLNNPIPLKDKIDLQIIWKENWSTDTIPFYLIREINEDKCFCNGTSWSFGSFTIPETPDFDCACTRLVFSPTVKPNIIGDALVCKGAYVKLESDKSFAKYEWNNGDVNKTSYYFNAGKALLKVTDSLGCMGFDSIEITESLPPEITIAADKKLLCRGECTELRAVSDTMNLIIWNVVDTTRKITVCPQADASYFVIAISKDNCISQAQIGLKVNSSPKPTLGNDPKITCGNQFVKLNVIDADLGFGRKSQWFGPGISNAQKDSLSVIVSTPGKYWFEVKDTISSCQGADTIIVLTDTIRPISNAGPDKILNCRDTKLNLIGDSSNTGAGFNILWQGPGINISNRNDINPQIDKPGIYIINISNVNNDCESKDTVVVSSNFAKPKADAGIDRFLFCDSSSVTLDGTNSSSGLDDKFIWSGPGIDTDNIKTLRPIVSKAGTYTLVITNSKSFCVDSNQVIVSAPDTIADILLTKSNDLGCMMDSVFLSASKSKGKLLRFTWKGPNGIFGTTNDSIVVFIPGRYYLFIYDSLTHCSDFDSITVIDGGGRPFVNAGPDKTITCELPSVVLTGSVNIPNNSSTIVWSGSGITGANNGILQPVVTKPGEYILRITDKRNNCMGNDTVIVSQNLIKPTINLGQDFTLNCIKDSVDVLAQIIDSKPSYDFRWSGPGVSVSTQRNNPLTITIPGIYTAIITTPNPECNQNDTLLVNIDTLRTPLEISDTLWFNCENKNILFNISDFSILDSVEWYNSFNKKVNLANLGKSINFQDEGLHYYIAHYKNGCNLKRFFIIIPYAIIKADPPIITPSCTDVGTGTVKIKVREGNPPFTFSLDGSRADTITFYNDLTAGPHKIRITDRNGVNCFLDVFFTVPALLSLPNDLGKEPDSVHICKDTILKAVSIFTNKTQNRYPKDSVTYQWFKNDNSLNSPGDSIKIESEGTYSLLIKNKNGCGELKLLFLVSQDQSDIRELIKLPNVFTPGELTNNIFRPVIDPIVQFTKGTYHLKIYSRWGEVVFETDNKDLGWDGNFKGTQASSDTYFVILTTEDVCGSNRGVNIKTSLNLIR